MRAFALFATTADIGIEVWGRDQRQLLRHAVAGLNALLFGPPRPQGGRSRQRPVRVRAFRYRGDGPESVLVNLLAEALALAYGRQRMVCGLRFRRASRQLLDADLLLAPLPAAPAQDVKGVTYHGLRIRSRAGRKYARIVLDV